MKFIFPRLSRDKRRFMADSLRYYANKEVLMQYDRAMIMEIAKQLCEGQIEVEVVVSK